MGWQEIVRYIKTAVRRVNREVQREQREGSIFFQHSIQYSYGYRYNRKRI